MSSAIIDSLTFGDEQCVPPGIEWRVSDGLVAYDTAVAVMEARASAIAAGTAGELIWLLQHPP
ncbi:MAG: lipoate-protein ligase B, partial [Xanthobacteraceae bacterium]